MNRRIVFIGVGAITLIIILAAAWYLASPLIIDRTVDEEFPFQPVSNGEFDFAANADSGISTPESEEMESSSAPNQEDFADQATPAAEAILANQSITETQSASATEFSVVSEGQFVGADSIHEGSGTAIVFQNDGQRVLRFEEFSVTNGPDLHVFLSKHPAPNSRADVGEEYIDLGSLKGNIGSQNYEIPVDIDLSDYKSVVIYCVPFHVIFATAALN